MNGAYVMLNVLFTLIYFKHSYFWTQLKRLSLSLSNLYAENIVEKKNCWQMQAAYMAKSVHFQPSLQRFSPSKQVVQLLKDIVIIHRYLNWTEVVLYSLVDV